MNISANSLFHFTNKFEHLQNVVSSGFKFRPCEEELPLSGYENCPFDQLGIIEHFQHVPVVCFCDLPLGQSSEHREQYGQYAIALSKEWGIRSKITPIRYVHSNSPDFASVTSSKILDLPVDLGAHGNNVFQFFSRILRDNKSYLAPTNEDLANLPVPMQNLMSIVSVEFLSLLQHCRDLMPLVRIYEGEWTDRVTNQTAHRVFYDEREWRAVSWDSQAVLQFKFADIRHIIVQTEDERTAIANQMISQAEQLGISMPHLAWTKVRIAEELFGDA